MLYYALQLRRHQSEGRVVVREGPDDPSPLPDLAVNALDPVVRPDSAPVPGGMRVKAKGVPVVVYEPTLGAPDFSG